MTRQPSWRLRLEGQPCLIDDHGGGPLVLSRKDAAWLACAALEPGVRSQRVATRAWPATDERGALNNLRQRVHQLRKKTGARLVEMAETLVLATDLRRDEDHLSWAALQADPGAWDDEPLGDLTYDGEAELAAWVAGVRERHRQRRREALAAIADAAEREGRHADALMFAQHLHADDPLSEPLHRQLMRLHHALGDVASALRVYDRAERSLSEELGLRPSAETLVLRECLLQGRQPVIGALPDLPATLARPPRLIGRERPLRALAQARSLGQPVLVVGEAGAGKSRLLQEALGGLADVLHLAAQPDDAQAPFTTVQRLLSRLRRWPLAPAATGAEPDARLAPMPAQRLRHQIADALAAALQRGLGTVVIDDLHFADAASHELLQGLILAAEPPTRPAWVLASRPLAADAAQPWTNADHLQWLELPPLDAHAVHDFVASLSLPGVDAQALAPALLRHAGGLPLHLLETLRAGLQDGGLDAAALPHPASIERRLQARLARLPTESAALARLVAVAGSDFDIELAEHLTHRPAVMLADAWHRLETAQVLDGEGFAHELVRQAVLALTPRVVARRIHRQVAQALTARGGEPARLAAHWEAGGEPAHAAAAYEAAADRAHAASRPREQAALLRQAAAAWEAAGHGGAALRARARAIVPTVLGEGLDPALQASTALIEAEAEAADLGHAWAAHATALVWGGRATEAEPAAQQALHLLPAHAVTPRREALQALAMALSMQGRAPQAVALLQPGWPMLDQQASPADCLDYAGAYLMALVNAGRLGDSLAVARRQLGWARATDNRLAELNAWISVGYVHLKRGEARDAVDAGREARELGRGVPELQTQSRMNDVALALAEATCGHFRAALPLARSALEHMSQAMPGSNFQAVAALALAWTWLQLGEPGRALPLLQQDLPNAVPESAVQRRLLLGQAAELLGAPEAERHYREAAAIEPTRRMASTLLAELALQRRAADTAAAHAAWAVMQEAQARELHGVAAEAAATALQARATAAPRTLDPDDVAHAEHLVRQYRAAYTSWTRQWLACAAAYTALGDVAAAARCRSLAAGWLQQTLQTQVPPEGRAGFGRHPWHAELLQPARGHAGWSIEAQAGHLHGGAL